MTNVTMKASDTLHVSSVKADNILPGEEFEVSGAVADVLEERGLAERVGAKMANAPANKAAPAPGNKAEKPPVSAATVPAKKGKK